MRLAKVNLLGGMPDMEQIATRSVSRLVSRDLIAAATVRSFRETRAVEPLMSKRGAFAGQTQTP